MNGVIGISALIASSSCAVGLATFFIGRHGAAKKEGEWRGELKATMSTLLKDVEEIKRDVKDSNLATKSMLQKEEEARTESDRRIHARIDEHILKYHG